MNRYHITLGAKTTAGGIVMTASSCCSINGVKVAVEGDSIVCPACRSKGVIRNFGPRIPESWNGKQVALQDDLCVCACPSPPRLIANQHLKYQNIGGGGGSGDGGNGGAAHTEAAAAGIASAVRTQAQAAALTEQAERVALRFVDDFTQAPIASKRYRLELPERTIEGQTDANGYTQAIDIADRDRLVAWQILD
jgi:uncharacterized Zn-binding protein involved in type VI secretion